MARISAIQADTAAGTPSLRLYPIPHGRASPPSLSSLPSPAMLHRMETATLTDLPSAPVAAPSEPLSPPPPPSATPKPSKPRKSKGTASKPTPRTLDPASYAQEIASAVIAGKPIPGSSDLTHQHQSLTRLSRAQLAKLIGPDVDAFRSSLADKLLATADALADAIFRDIDSMKTGERAFALSAVVDKGEQLRGKLASSPHSAAVNVQVNIGSDASIRSSLLASFGLPKAHTERRDVEPHQSSLQPPVE